MPAKRSQASQGKPVRKAPAERPSARRTSSSRNPRYGRVRIRMYRQGLGDCFLLSFRKKQGRDFQMLIDCGVLKGTEDPALIMGKVAADVARETGGVIDLLVVTHEHWDHLSGFHQARAAFDNLKIKEVWMPWTEDPKDKLAQKLRDTKTRTLQLLIQGLTNHTGAGPIMEGVASLLGFCGLNQAAAAGGGQTTGDALDYLRKRSQEENGTRYLKPGAASLDLPGVEDFRIYVIGPPRNEKLLLKSDATKKEKDDHLVFEARAGMPASLCAMAAALAPVSGEEAERYTPFGREHRRNLGDGACGEFMEKHYLHPDQEWRQIGYDWLGAMGQVALKLDSDTNNTSLVLAMEFPSTGEVMLFVGDAQVGNWLSWADVDFDRAEGNPDAPKLKAHDLISRTVFYKCGHHGSHNATLQEKGLNLMEREDLVVFIPVDKAMAARQGGRDHNGNPKGWKMPARALMDALKQKARGRVVLSDPAEHPAAEAVAAGVVGAPLYVDYFL